VVFPYAHLLHQITIVLGSTTALAIITTGISSAFFFTLMFPVPIILQWSQDEFLIYTETSIGYVKTLFPSCCHPLIFNQMEPSVLELVFIILNYVTCVPVLLAVGGFRSDYFDLKYSTISEKYFDSIYHFYCLMGNSTTIEGWEKDKAATLIRRGQIREVRVLFRTYIPPAYSLSAS
jgi:hypothetical protein